MTSKSSAGKGNSSGSEYLKSGRLEGAVRSNITHYSIFGEVLWLCTQSTLHKSVPLSQVHRALAPAFQHRQFRLYRRQGQPIAFVSWARLSKPAETIYLSNQNALSTSDWVGGDRLWLMTWIAPFGDSAYVIKDLREGVFRNEVGRALHIRKDGDEPKIVHFWGLNALRRGKDFKVNAPVDVQGAAHRSSQIIRLDALVR